MIGDVTQKTGSKAEAYVSKKGGVNRTVAPSTGPDDNISGGDRYQRKTAKRMGKGMKPGTGLKNPGKDTPAPFKEKAGPGKRSGYKTTADDSVSDGGGAKALSRAACNAWCEGKRGSYK
jgi:hypothetical protein